jgi:CBS domain-containing protein
VRLADVLKSDHILLPLKAGTVKEATEQLADRLVAAGAVAEPQRLLAVIKHAWPEDMVSVGEHAFLPHFRTEAVRSLATAVGISPTPIRWEKDPNRTARIVILIVAPPRETPTYLQVVGALARTLSDPANVLALLAAKSADQVVGLAALTAIDLPSQLTVRDVMTTHVLSIGPERSLGEAARFMVEHDIRALPVVDEAGSLLGIITHRELLRYLIPGYLKHSKSGEFQPPTKAQIQRGSGDPRLTPVKEAMARTVLCLSEDQTLADIANLISSKDVDRFPVVREGVVVGFLTRADLIRRIITAP